MHLLPRPERLRNTATAAPGRATALYLENQLKQFNTRERNNDNAVMHSIASKLTELEVKAVSSYISTLE